MYSTFLLARSLLHCLRLLASAALAVKRISKAASSVGASSILLLVPCFLHAAACKSKPVWFLIFAAIRFFFSAQLASMSKASASLSDVALRTRSVVDSDLARRLVALIAMTLGAGTDPARFEATCLLLTCSPIPLLTTSPTALWLVTGVTSA